LNLVILLTTMKCEETCQWISLLTNGPWSGGHWTRPLRFVKMFISEMIQCNPNWGPKVLPTIILIYLIPTIWIHRFYIRDYMYSTPIHNSYTHLKYFIYKVLETYFQGPILNLEVKTLHIMPCSCNLYRT
jgi:hypothetical protein